jgi:hypothetical protein
MSLEAVAEESSCKFLVHSATKIDFYPVDLVDAYCNCRTLRCEQCNICIHRFKCSLPRLIIIFIINQGQ